MSVDVASLQMENARLRGELDAVKTERGYLFTEVDELQAELAEQKRLNLALAERLAACSQVLGRAAERGKVCG